MDYIATGAPERKFAGTAAGGSAALSVSEGHVISGYASLFGQTDQGGDVVQQGAYAASLARLKAAGRSVKMLWQHDPAQPIGLWDEVREDARGLWVSGRIITAVDRGREAAALLGAGAIDGLSIGYRTQKSTRSDSGARILTQIELWEVSLVTFPMLLEARVLAKNDTAEAETWAELAAMVTQARQNLKPLR
jgi:HK97 family phage prohead protease